MSRIRVAVMNSIFPILIFLILTFTQGIHCLFSVGPLTIPDPDLNAMSSYVFAEGQILNVPETVVDDFGNTTKRQYITGDSRFLSLKGRRNTLVTPIIQSPLYPDPRIRKQQSINQDQAFTVTSPQHGEFYNRSNQYFPLVYLPQAVGMRIGLTSGMAPYQVWQAGRISNLVFFMVLMSTAIVLIPRAKYFMALFGSLPPVAFIASSLMSDALFIGLAACFIGLFYKISMRTQAITRGQMAGLIILPVLLFYSKMVYVTLAILIFALPAHILSRKRKVLVITSSAVIALLTFLPWHFTYALTPAIVNVDQNKDWILNNPILELLSITWNIVYLPNLIIQMQPVANEVILVLGVAWIVLICQKQNTKSRINESPAHWFSRNRYIIVSAIACLSCLFLTYLALSITWNNMPTHAVAGMLEGFQGRYLLPLLPLLVCVSFQAETKTASKAAHKALTVDHSSKSPALIGTEEY